MKITSSIISDNLEKLEKSKKDFPILIKYEKSIDFHEKLKIREEANQFNLKQFVDFIDFITEMESNNQSVFYRKKITNKEFQNILIKNAIENDAKKSFSRKSKKSFQQLINSDKWYLFTGEEYKIKRRSKRYINNLSASSAIIANFIIQSEIEIDDDKINRISKWYTTPIINLEKTILDEISLTKELIEVIIKSIKSSDIDFRKLNYSYLTTSLSEEVKSIILNVEKGEKIRCISSENIENITPSKIYDVLDKKMGNIISGGGSILLVCVQNDLDNIKWYPYRNFETVVNMRDKFLDNLLNL